MKCLLLLNLVSNGGSNMVKILKKKKVIDTMIYAKDVRVRLLNKKIIAEKEYFESAEIQNLIYDEVNERLEVFLRYDIGKFPNNNGNEIVTLLIQKGWEVGENSDFFPQMP